MGFDDDVIIILIMNNFSFGPNSWIEILTMRQRVERERVEVIRLSKTKGEEHCRENKNKKNGRVSRDRESKRKRWLFRFCFVAVFFLSTNITC